MTEEDTTSEQRTYYLNEILQSSLICSNSVFDHLQQAHKDLQHYLDMPIAPVYFTVVSGNKLSFGWTVKCVIRPCTKPITTYGTADTKYDATRNAAKALLDELIDIIRALKSLGPIVQGQVEDEEIQAKP